MSTDGEASFMAPVLDDRLYIAHNVTQIPDFPDFRAFVPSGEIAYQPLCNDFGPMNMAATIKFVKQLDTELTNITDSRLIYVVDDGPRALTNAVFLVGAYMILRLGWDAHEVGEAMSRIDEGMMEGYRDATFAPADFRLTLGDCWRGLARGRDMGWVPADKEQDYMWGCVDVDEYEHYDSPLNGDMHEVVPGKFVAFRGPKRIHGAKYLDRDSGIREFSPEHYADLFGDFGVEVVVRLNEAEYDCGAFAVRGMRCVELPFEDCSAPPIHLVDEFLAAAEGARGAVAVHCKAGLGRTGTLIALYMMRHHGFSAREAMGWLRIMRPGSVIGEQQHFLCAYEGQGSGVAGWEGDSACRAALAADVCGAVERRGVCPLAGTQAQATLRSSESSPSSFTADSPSDTPLGLMTG